MLPQRNFAKTRALAETADLLGYHGVGLGDHLFVHRGDMQLPEEPLLECYTTMGAIAAVTQRVIMTQVVGANSFRNPALLAKIASTLDNISGGRFELGIGSGWLREEYEAYGYSYPSNAERIDQLGEGIQIIKAMWTHEAPSFRVRYFQIEKAFSLPKPVRKPHPKILIGGSGKKILDIIVRHADIVNIAPSITTGHVDPAKWARFSKDSVRAKVETLRRLTEAAGRRADAIEISVSSSIFIAEKPGEAEATALRVAKAMGIPTKEAERQAPGGVELFAREVLPGFGS
jgi:alkanesulfonate monooxygenase SsuD/methylene tetrahydromethanopterin reductase-like flavin-dependent oxidoreductase (luciferase family)